MKHTSESIPLLVAGLLVLTACTARTGNLDRFRAQGAAPGGQILTQEEILRTGANDAFEAIQRGGTHLLIERPEGRGEHISRRGSDSLVLSSAILLVVDGSRVTRPGPVLRSIPTSSIVFIQILSGSEASVRWGSEASNGVVLVRTSAF